MSRPFRLSSRSLAIAGAFAVALPAVAIVSLDAFAHGPGRSGGWHERGPMAEFRDADGRFDRAAFEARMQEHYDAMLAAGDGTVDRETFARQSVEIMRPHMEEGAARMFDRLDRDGDGVLSAEEFAAAKQRMGERMADGRRHGPRDGQRDRGPRPRD